MIRKKSNCMFVMIVIGFLFLCTRDGFTVDNCCGLNSPGNRYACGPHPSNSERYGNCVWYARYKRIDVDGKAGGNGRDWYGSAVASNMATGQVPVKGSIAVFNWTSPRDGINYGHVAYIESVDNDNDDNPRNNVFNVTEMGWDYYDCVQDNYYQDGVKEMDGLLGFIYPVGVYEDLSHKDDILEAYLEAYKEYGGDEVVGHPIDNGGGVFVHEWKSSTDPSYSVWIQDFYNPDTEEWSSLVLNDLDPLKYIFD